MQGHIEGMCNNWYQKTNLMVRHGREEKLQTAFLEVVAKNTNAEGGVGEGHECISNSTPICLEQNHDMRFTDVEKEHLTYE